MEYRILRGRGRGRAEAHENNALCAHLCMPQTCNNIINVGREDCSGAVLNKREINCTGGGVELRDNRKAVPWIDV